MTTEELDAIERYAKADPGNGGDVPRLVAEVRRLQTESDALLAGNATLARLVNGQPLPPGHVAVSRARVEQLEAERDALQAALQKCVEVMPPEALKAAREAIVGSPVPANPPDTVAVPRSLLVSILAYGLSDDDVERLCAVLKEERERLGVPR